MDYAIPKISISLAPPEDPLPDPTSPFTSLAFATKIVDSDGFRPSHLTPPPTPTSLKRALSPLIPTQDSGKGLDSHRFQALLNATRERGANNGGKKHVDLRKEIALKVHKNKQVERRALFLSKVQAPPSPTAALTPKTPPDSPAIFHYTLPSPGLVSPLALFESLHDSRDGVRCGWVEQVDFKQAKPVYEKAKVYPGLPTLDQISARLIPRVAQEDLPEFPALSPRKGPKPRPSLGVGRLRMPLRTQPTIVPRTHSPPSLQLTEINLDAFNSRDQRAHNMLSTLRRRMAPSERNINSRSDETQVQLKWRRRSAPADLMPLRARIGFEHPILALPGGF
ncbi:hypothetical protein M413DRAFT_61602 [Hebeloma cylindrosporum]|uniref:Uncharacterized protein n=1 Tax=Hebeloma cylindrosporum TaxID=76867 RepID=A0A0C3CH04_HEBCY|nr:hypothetical protein M413DRAFT_61602 [Hebeloma cylindrosporum h7]